MQQRDDILGAPVRTFVDTYVRSLLTWDVLAFYHRNPDAILDINALSTRLGRPSEELQPEIDMLCRDGIVRCGGGVISYSPEPAMRETIGAFADASQERQHRLALIAVVLQKIAPAGN